MSRDPEQEPESTALITRSAATALGLALYLFSAAKGVEGRGFEVPLLTAAVSVQVTFFAGLAALHCDAPETRKRLPDPPAAVFWTGAVFCLNWGAVTFFRQTARLYAEFGLPPIYGPVI
ncbi:hypothetical protein ACSHT0_13335 [Tepidicaulis sp. LMO-SS28]|uniref:hypothetical protein n=1 Tax=Tepidicaulis sp. LMO-SS28 TaxID=3447455 RepID=UPI003EE1AE76